MAQLSVNAAVLRQLQELYRKLNITNLAMRMWRELMTEQDRRKLLRLVNREPHNPKFGDDLEIEEFPLNEELLEGSPGKTLHRCYYRWRSVGMWMKARNLSQPKAIVELAFEHEMINEAVHRRLLLAIGEAENTPNILRPSWNRETGALEYAGQLVREIPAPARSKNIVQILDTFELEGWPQRIDDPLPKRDPERRRDAIRRLNLGLKVIHFRSDGSGQGIVWEVATHTQPSRRVLRRRKRAGR